MSSWVIELAKRAILMMNAIPPEAKIAAKESANVAASHHPNDEKESLREFQVKLS